MADNGRDIDLLTGDLSPEEEKLLSALLCESSVKAAATRAKISERSAYRYLERPKFKEVYKQARRETVGHAIAQVQSAASEAVDTLRTLMKDAESPVPSRVSAARILLDTAVKVVELEDVVERLERLEEMAAMK